MFGGGGCLLLSLIFPTAVMGPNPFLGGAVSFDFFFLAE